MRRIVSKIEVNVYEVEFTYTTTRGNWKKQTWEVPALSEKGAETQLKIHLLDYNNEHPYRAYLNVEILRIAFKRTELIAA